MPWLMEIASTQTKRIPRAGLKNNAASTSNSWSGGASPSAVLCKPSRTASCRRSPRFKCTRPSRIHDTRRVDRSRALCEVGSYPPPVMPGILDDPTCRRARLPVTRHARQFHAQPPLYLMLKQPDRYPALRYISLWTSRPAHGAIGTVSKVAEALVTSLSRRMGTIGQLAFLLRLPIIEDLRGRRKTRAWRH